MRVISQDGVYDTPYEITQLWIQERNGVADLYHIRGSMPADEAITLAIYSSEEKALKTMEMLREQYSRIEIIKALASGTCEHMEESLKPEEFNDILEKYINMEVFQLPQDDEIEV